MAHSCHTSKRTKIYFPKMRCTEFPIIYSKSFWSSLLRRQLVVFWSLQIFVRDIFLISQKMWLWICSLHIHEFETANVQCVWASCTPLVIIIIIISYIFNFRPFKEHGWLLGLAAKWHSRSVGLFVRLRSLRTIYPERAKYVRVCVCMSLSQFECGILHSCNFIYRKRRMHIVIRYFFFCFVWSFSISLSLHMFVLSSSRYHTFFIHSRLFAFITSKRTAFAVNSKKMNRK